MIFEYLISFEIKNDQLTQDTDPEDLSIILQTCLLDNLTRQLPWVIKQEITEITRDATFKLVRKEPE